MSENCGYPASSLIGRAWQAAQFRRIGVGSESGTSSLEASGCGQITDYDGFAADIADKLGGDLHCFAVIAG